jgi:hypothetical protein
MERVIRVCDITGRKTVVADGIPMYEAMELIRKLSAEDEFAHYYRITL